LVTGLDSTTWSWKPCREFVSASRSGGDDVTQKMGERSAKAVARPGKALQKPLFAVAKQVPTLPETLA
jgi:hypothetical protein